jgi:thioredoxin
MVLEITEDNFNKEVEKSKIPVIIDFFADWCSPCQMMKPVFESASLGYKDKLKFAKVNTEIYPELAQRFDISGIPCFIIVKNGEEIDRIIGYKPEAELKKAIDSILF